MMPVSKAWQDRIQASSKELKNALLDLQKEVFSTEEEKSQQMLAQHIWASRSGSCLCFREDKLDPSKLF